LLSLFKAASSEAAFFMSSRHLQLVSLFCPVAVAVAAIAWGASRTVIVHGTYGALLVTTLLWLFFLGKVFFKDGGFHFAGKLRQYPFTAVCLPFALWLLLGLEPFGQKIVYDEPILQATAESLHLEKEAAMPTAGIHNGEEYEILRSSLDKRPFVFPFFVSVIHDLSGHRSGNAFLLNGVVSAALLLVLASTGTRLAGDFGGVLVLLGAAGLPILATMATSAHFSVLNLLLLALLFRLLLSFSDHPGHEAAGAFLFTAILFLQVRYENLVLLVPLFACFGFFHYKTKLEHFPRAAYAIPLLLVPAVLHFTNLWLHRSSFFQSGPGNREALFSISYLPENLLSAGRFFLDFTWRAQGSWFLSIGGGIAVATAIWSIVHALRKRMKAPEPAMVFAALAVAVILQFATVLLFNYGLLDDYKTARLSLPVQFLLIVALPFAVGAFPFRRWLGASLLATGVVHLLFFALPINYLHLPTSESPSRNLIAAEVKFLDQLDGTDRGESVLWLSSANYNAIVAHVSCWPLLSFKNEPGSIEPFRRGGGGLSVFIARRLDTEDPSHPRWAVKGEDLSEMGLPLSPELYQVFGDNMALRIDQFNLPKQP
jgi:hypothetical protein